MLNKKTLIILILLGLILSFLLGLQLGRTRGIPFVEKQEKWAIGIYTGQSPLKLDSPANISNPVISASDVTDREADFVADPFMVKEGDSWYLFFEVETVPPREDDIALAESLDGINWEYKQVVLDEPFDLTFPYVFKWADEYYMMPETSETNSVRLYKATDFPTEWKHYQTLIEGEPFLDNCIFHYQDRWWIFASLRKTILKLYSAESLFGPWEEHPRSPVVLGDDKTARSGGRVTEYDGKLIRFAQDCSETYGKQLLAFEITRLTPEEYEEKELSESPVLKPTGRGWNALKMHQLDAHQVGENQWTGCVDGFGEYWIFDLKY